MAVVILKEVNRLPGLSPEGDVVAGEPLMMGSTASKVKRYVWNGVGTQPEVLGLALETTIAFSSLSSIPTFKLNDDRGLNDPTRRPTSDRPSGDLTVTGTFYDTVNRGGLVSAMINGAELDLYDDGRGSPFEAVPTTAYALNFPVYADNVLSKVTSDATDGANPNKKIGSVMKVPTDGILRIKVEL